MSEIIEIKGRVGKSRILEMIMAFGSNSVSCADAQYGIPRLNYVFYGESDIETLIDTIDEILKPDIGVIRVVPTEYFIIYTNGGREVWEKYMEVFQQIKNKYQYVYNLVLMHK